MLVLSYYLLVAVAFRQGGTDVALFLSISVVVWKFFTAGTRNALVITAAKERQMRHVRFPRAVLPLSSLLAETVRFAFALVILIAVIGLLGPGLDITLPLILPIVAIQLLFALGTAFLLGALNVFFRDVQHITFHAFQAWFFLSPGLYTIDAIPQEYRRVYDINPFAHILPAYHSLLLNHELANPIGLVKVAGVSVATLVLGYLVFVRLQPAFAKVT
jgi:lipopolysaccharide transport system permease protein